MIDSAPQSALLSGMPELVTAACRSGLIAMVAVTAAHHVVGTLRHLPHPAWRRGGMILLALPLLTPRFLVAYAYMAHAQSAAVQPVYHQLLYSALLVGMLIPAAAAVLALTPPPATTRSAVHCHRLLRPANLPTPGHRRGMLRITFQRHAPSWCMASILVFLLAFNEMEMASFFGVSTWTVRLFDLQAGGLPMRSLLTQAALPVLLEALLMMSGIAMVSRVRGRPQWVDTPPTPPGTAAMTGAALYLVTAPALICIAPLAVALAPTLTVAQATWTDLAIGASMRNTLLFSGVATVCVMAVAGIAPARRWNAVRVGLSLPGLLGTLTMGLCLLALFHLPPLRRLAGTPLPLLTAMTLHLMPFAMLLVVALRHRYRDPDVHAVALLRAGHQPRQRRSAAALRWHRVRRPWLLATMFLFLLACYDVVLASLLAPADLPPVMVMVYNQMHYGTSQRLSAIVVAVTVIPLLPWVMAVAVRRAMLSVHRHA